MNRFVSLTVRLLSLALPLASSACNPLPDVPLDADASPDINQPVPDAEFDYGPSPRPDGDAEQLALSIGTDLLATDADYERIQRDLARIRTLQPHVADIRPIFPHNPSELLVALVPGRTSDDFDALNAYYQATSSGVFLQVLSVTFPGRLNISLLAEEYARLPEVEFAEANSIIGGSDTIGLSTADDGAWTYTFTEGSMDCPAGCLCGIAWTFRTQPDGGVEQTAITCRDAGIECNYPDFCP